MSKLQLAQRWLAVVALTGALAACSGEATAPPSPLGPDRIYSDRRAAALQQSALRTLLPAPSLTLTHPRCDKPLTSTVWYRLR